MDDDRENEKFDSVIWSRLAKEKSGAEMKTYSKKKLEKLAARLGGRVVFPEDVESGAEPSEPREADKDKASI